MATETISTWGAVIKGVGAPFLEFFNQGDFTDVSGFSPVVKTIRSGDQVSHFSGKTGTGRLTRHSDGSVIPDGNRYKLYNTDVALEPYSTRLTITRQTFIYRSFEGTFSESNDLMVAFRSTLAHAAAQIFNRGFTDGSGITAGVKVVQYGDAAPPFSASHPRADGGTAQSNTSPTSIPLTETNLETARIALYKQLQDNGERMTGAGQLWLVVPIDLDKTAQIITGSNLRSGTANNDTNIYGGGAVKVMSSTLLSSGVSGASVGSNTQWFLVAEGWAKLAVVVGNGAPELDFLKDKDTKSRLFDLTIDLGVCSYDYRGTWGSLGDNSSYSG